MGTATLIFILLISGAVLISALSRQAFERCLPLWLFIIVALLYLFGISGFLEEGVYAAAALSAAALVWDIYLIIRKRIKLSSVFTPGFAAFVFLILLSWWAQRGRLFTQWDEFSHWGLTVKNMYVSGSLSGPSSTVYFTGYPPGAALFEYLWVRLPGAYSESGIFSAMNIFYFSLALPLLAGLKWRNFVRILLRLALIVLLPLVFFSDFYTSIYVDGILGALFAYVLITHFSGEINTFGFINTGLSLFILTLVKDSGLGLAAIALIIIAVDLLFFRRSELKKFIARQRRSGTTGRVLALLCPLLLVLTAKFSWALYLSVSGISPSGGAGIALSGLSALFSGSAPAYRYQTISAFIGALFKTPLSAGFCGISFAGWLAILAILGAALTVFLCKKGERKRFAVSAALVLVCALVFAVFLLFLYLFNFSEYEAVILASFGRYISTYMLGALIFLSAMIMLKDTGEKRKAFVPIGLLLAVLLTAYIPAVLKITVLAPRYTLETQKLRSVYSEEERINTSLDPKRDRIYFISIGDKGFDYWVTRYTLTPLKINDNFTWSLGKPYFHGDIWTKDETPEDWVETLKENYTFVYVFKTNDAFSSVFGGLFEGGPSAVQSGTLYRVDKSEGRVIIKKAVF